MRWSKLRALPNLTLDASREGALTTSLSNQTLATLVVKNLFLKSN